MRHLMKVRCYVSKTYEVILEFWQYIYIYTNVWKKKMVVGVKPALKKEALLYYNVDATEVAAMNFEIKHVLDRQWVVLFVLWFSLTKKTNW